MEIQAAIVHQIFKEQHKPLEGVQYRDELLENDEKLTKLIEKIRSTYGKTSSIGCGTFDREKDFPLLLQSFQAQVVDFVSLSKRATEIIANAADTASASTGGYAVFVLYKERQTPFLMVTMVKLEESVEITADLELTETLILNKDRIHEAMRIDLNKWALDQQPYLTFINKRSAQEGVSAYFRKTAMGCSDYTDSKHFTEELLGVLKEFARVQNMTDEEKQILRDKTYGYCDEIKKRNEPLDLKILAQRIHEENPEYLIEFINNGDYTVPDGFEPHAATYKKWRKIKSSTGWLSIEFDIGEIGNRVELLTDDKDELVGIKLSDISEDLKTKIKEARL